MPIAYLDAKRSKLEITSYNGNSGKKETSRLESSSECLFPSQTWNFFRQEDNQAYVKGNVFYEDGCRNNVIISPCRNNRLVDVKNAFVFVGDSFIEVSPISNISNAIDKGKRKLSGQEISYHIPQSVFEKENLIEKDMEELKREIKKRYEIKPKIISEINSGRTKNGIYYIKGKDGREYVLKFKGKNKERAELLSKIAGDIPHYFPINFHRKDSSQFTFEIGEELYGLEEFIRGSNQKPRDLRYFSLLGNQIGLLHNHFSSFLKRNKWVEKVLAPSGSRTSESNFISFYFDLATNKNNNAVLLSELEKIIEGNLDNQMSFFPRQLIHRDLNHSNLIWQGGNFKIVDSETIKISTRLDEFESPLLFRGNMEKPQYIRDSLGTIIHAYNQSSEESLSKEEIRLLPFLLKYTFLRNFVVREIRRGIDEKHYLGETIKNLKIIDEDSC